MTRNDGGRDHSRRGATTGAEQQSRTRSGTTSGHKKRSRAGEEQRSGRERETEEIRNAADIWRRPEEERAPDGVQFSRCYLVKGEGVAEISAASMLSALGR